MENGSFHAKLNAIDFENDDFSFPIAKSNSPSFSSSVDSLLRQNEDLSARMKVTTQRLIQFESSLQEESEKNQALLKLQQNHQDQLLVWKEKERLWLEKLEIAEQKNHELDQRFPQYVQMQAEILRYKKYHEKVKTQIKPYIQQLKDYSKGLVDEVRELHRELSNQELQLQRAQSRVQELTGELKLQMKAHESSMSEMSTGYQAEIKALQTQWQSLKESHIVLENKTQRLDQTLARQDELDNLLIEYKRKFDESENRLVQETEGLRQSLQIARNDLTKKNLMIETFTEKDSQSRIDQTRLQTEIQNLNDQMTSLRFLWTEKSSEVEQLRASVEALEKINRELSQKLNSSRQA